jgi:hypothetical protein
VVAVTTTGYALAYMNIYRAPDARLDADGIYGECRRDRGSWWAISWHSSDGVASQPGLLQRLRPVGRSHGKARPPRALYARRLRVSAGTGSLRLRKPEHPSIARPGRLHRDR